MSYIPPIRRETVFDYLSKNTEQLFNYYVGIGGTVTIDLNRPGKWVFYVFSNISPAYFSFVFEESDDGTTYTSANVTWLFSRGVGGVALVVFSKPYNRIKLINNYTDIAYAAVFGVKA